MDSFNRRCREPLLTIASAEGQRQRRMMEITSAIDLLEHHLGQDGYNEHGWSEWNGTIAYSRWSLMVLDYSQGEDIEKMADALPDVIQAEERSCLPNAKHPTNTYHLAERDTYPYILSLLTFAKLLHHDTLVPRVAALVDVDRTRNRGQDKLYETILHKLGLPAEPAEATFRHFKAHPLLLEAIEAPVHKRPALMKAFLKKWYPSMKGVIWHDKHKKNPLSFIGYWCWEAALVTYLWDMDDATYRDMTFYPKDLVDWARKTALIDPAAQPRVVTPAHMPSGMNNSL